MENPPWWDWELDCGNPHRVKRMADRSFSEVDLREMLERAVEISPDHVPDRFLIRTRLADKPWEVIVEPDHGSSYWWS
jgi:hypothetical protein